MTNLYVGILALLVSMIQQGTTDKNFWGLMIHLGYLLPIFISLWFIARRAGESGQAILAPVVSEIVLLKITGRSRWWLIPLLVPVACFLLLNQIQAESESGALGSVIALLQFSCYVAWVVVVSGLADRFQKGIGLVLALLFLPFIALPILAFSTYRPPYRRERWRARSPQDGASPPSGS